MGSLGVLPGSLRALSSVVLETIAYDQGTGGVVGETPLAQQGRPFYGAEVHWIMLPRFPEPPAAPSTEEPKK